MPGKDFRRAGPRELLRDVLDLAALAIAACLIALVVTGAAGLPRILLALAFAFFVPGRAVVANWPRLAYWSDFGLPIVISLTVLTLAAAIALWVHLWHPLGLFEIEAGVSVVALTAGLARRHRHRGGEPGKPDQLLQRGPVTGSHEPVTADAPAHELAREGSAVAGQRERGAADHIASEITPAGNALDVLLRFYSADRDSKQAGQPSNDGLPE